MKPKFPNRMKNISDVKNFAEYLLYVRKTQSNPDDPFEYYVDSQTGHPVFTPDECEYFNALMEEAAILCDMKDVDIHEIWHQVYYPNTVKQ